MLNISNNKVSEFIDRKKYTALDQVERKQSGKVFRRMIYISMATLLIAFFLPWTQNIRSKGMVTTLKPNQKPQAINAIIDGQIAEWYVQEGDFAQAGDTLLKITEIKDSYFDPQLLDRTAAQVDLKKSSIDTYGDKISAQDNQLGLLKKERDLKLSQIDIKMQQTALKITNDSLKHSAAIIDLNTAKAQYNRADSLYKKGLKSLTNLEQKTVKWQKALAYETEAKNKWLASKNEMINLEIELVNLNVKYETDYSKVLTYKYETVSNKLDAENALNKLENQYSNYLIRNGLYYITAPQDGYVTKTRAAGIGETIKTGEEILTFMPKRYDLAVELYVDPIDLPLIGIGEHVRIQFDGWPAIVFSGWPNASHGTYGGRIYAIDQYSNDKGQYRVLVEPDPEDHPWPDALRFGSGASSMVLLNDVPVWYELWRNINGFPPDFYRTTTNSKPTKK